MCSSPGLFAGCSFVTPGQFSPSWHSYWLGRANTNVNPSHHFDSLFILCHIQRRARVAVRSACETGVKRCYDLFFYSVNQMYLWSMNDPEIAAVWQFRVLELRIKWCVCVNRRFSPENNLWSCHLKSKFAPFTNMGMGGVNANLGMGGVKTQPHFGFSSLVRLLLSGNSTALMSCTSPSVIITKRYLMLANKKLQSTK